MKKNFIFLSLFTFHFSFCFSQTGIITTIGGENIGNNVTGTGFGINPYDMVADNQGNIYIADASNRLIHKLSSSGILTVVAGTGSYGYSGDGGPATNAQLEYPTSVAFDRNGNLYVVDQDAQVVREINMNTGIINTVAGDGYYGFWGDNGLAINAGFEYPVAIAFDTANNFYISDYDNNRIRKVTFSTGIITTIAGTDSTGYNRDSIPADSAWLHNPAGIAIDKHNNIYFVDQSNCRIREIKSNDTIYTLSGSSAGFSGDGGPASKAKFWYPLGIAVDTAGNIYIADTYEERIREITISNDTIRTICGNGNGSFSGDGGAATAAEIFEPHFLSFDADGNLYIADMGNNRVRELFASNKTINTLSGDGFPGYNGNNINAIASQLSSPTDIAPDSLGNVYISDNGNNMIRQIEISTGNILKIAGNGLAGNSGDGGPAGKAELNGPDGIALDDSGNVFIADEYNNKIREVKIASNTIITRVGDGTAGYAGDNNLAANAELYYPVDICFDNKGDMFIADMINNRIREIPYNSRFIKTVAGNGYNATNFGGGFSGDGGPATAAELYQPQGVTTDNNGNLYIADTWNERIRKVNLTTGIISTIAGNGNYGYSGDGGPASSAELSAPTGVSIDALGNVYIADFYNNVIRQVSAFDSTIVTIAGNGAAGFSGDGGPATDAELDLPHNIKFSNSGNLYIADNGNNRIREIEGPLGIKQLTANSEQLTVYPNPSSGKVNVIVNGELLMVNEMQLEIYNVFGEKVYVKPLPLTPYPLSLSIDLSNQPNGMYFIVITGNNELLTAKVVKE